MKDIKLLLEDIKIDKSITLSDIPEIDLYMDQVIQLFESKLSCLKRNEEDKILTKTMINNYSKGKLLMNIKNKKYSKNHIILLILIYELKSIMSISDIKIVLNNIVESYDKESEKDIDLEKFYQKHLEDIKDNNNNIEKEILDMTQNIKDLNNYEEKLELLMNLVVKANVYKRICEKMVDDWFKLD